VAGARTPARPGDAPGRLGTNEGDTETFGSSVADGGDVVASAVTKKS